MAMYRILQRLHIGGTKYLEPGQMAGLHWLTPEQIGRLEDGGAVSEIHAPPLRALPKWEKRAARLEPLNIITATDLLEADSKKVAEEIGVKPATVDRWKGLLKDKWLVVPEQTTARRGS